MPRFYFDVHDGVDICDEVGRELPDRAAVREEALGVAIKLLAAEAAEAKEMTLILTVRDQSGATPLKIRLVSQIEEG
ncbi:DUF6894 family protein [Methylobacterium haplocladii]|uniref:DUF6894 domain-containing protein n=1 Tax=Methylobacterium haplocladii TaxID=1176176 RepID=A0A512IMV7_9HYPH|nr:hypothetical protein [Methylobacterium haplocladii]GEO99039.1 hypothetical protein MHA02_14270 [Methylobacterium haplocladii]GJD84114.1 hypothetical protein HPGCJGGD_1989 [Methylobacterium haplocladii]GLS58961.1 hypothetical protein GCM10007887_16270 [Methylobacterium haplocladii]